MDLNKLLEWMELDERVLTKMIKDADETGKSSSFLAGNLNYIIKLKDAIEDGLFDDDTK